MRRCAASFILLAFLVPCAVSSAADGTVVKVLSQYLDKKGDHALSPSLYERDAYQAYLRKNPDHVSGMRLAVEWKASGVDWQKVRLRAELRGVLTNTLQSITLEEPLKKGHWFLLGNWAEFRVTGAKFKKFGDLVAWRVSLWEGDRELSHVQSYLWSGLPARIP